MKRLYEAHCSEHGERFKSYFKSSEKSMERLLDLGQQLAMEWGGECITVKLVPNVPNLSGVEIWDFDMSDEENMAGVR